MFEVVGILATCVCPFYCRLVSGAGDIKITKDGKVLLDEMVGTHRPTLLLLLFPLLAHTV